MTTPRSRGRRVPAVASADAAPVADSFVFSRPVAVDTSKLEMHDILLFGQIQQAGDNAAAQAALLSEKAEFLDRVVVGGIKGRPMAEFNRVLEEVNRQLSEVTDSKN